MVMNFFSPALSLIFLAATMLLLVFDLKRPDRFFYLLTKPNLRSWLVLGGYVLMIFGIFASVWLIEGITNGSYFDLDCLVHGTLRHCVGWLFRFSCLVKPGAATFGKARSCFGTC